MHISQHPTQTLELRVRELPQLFNSLDPTPFLNKDLDHACEAFIVSWRCCCRMTANCTALRA